MRFFVLLAFCVACGDDDGTINPDVGPPDTGTDAPMDAMADVGSDSGTDVGPQDVGVDAFDAGVDATLV